MCLRDVASYTKSTHLTESGSAVQKNILLHAARDSLQMIRPWSEIRSFYEQLVAKGASPQGMLRLVEQIEASKYVNGIHGETSACDLCITQLPKSSYPDAPYLRISPPSDGSIEFRYFDTYVRQRQWHRTVKEGEAFSRLERFFSQLHWFPRVRRKQIR